jgi:hypothetical protein
MVGGMLVKLGTHVSCINNICGHILWCVPFSLSLHSCWRKVNRKFPRFLHTLRGSWSSTRSTFLNTGKTVSVPIHLFFCDFLAHWILASLMAKWWLRLLWLSIRPLRFDFSVYHPSPLFSFRPCADEFTSILFFLSFPIAIVHLVVFFMVNVLGGQFAVPFNWDWGFGCWCSYMSIMYTLKSSFIEFLSTTEANWNRGECQK